MSKAFTREGDEAPDEVGDDGLTRGHVVVKGHGTDAELGRRLA